MLNQASMAERLAYGTPSDAEDDVMHTAPRPTAALIGRISMSLIFFISGIAKLTDTAGTAQHMEQAGIPEAHTLAIIAGIAELAGAASLLFGFLTRIGALGLILFMIPATLLFHDFWAYDGAEQKMQMINFLKNLGLTGGLCMVMAYGAGRYSLDARLRRPLQP